MSRSSLRPRGGRLRDDAERMSQAITMYNPLYLRRIREEEGVAVYAFSGTPVDCVKMAFITLLRDERVDMVISGVNHGSNSANTSSLPGRQRYRRQLLRLSGRRAVARRPRGRRRFRRCGGLRPADRRRHLRRGGRPAVPERERSGRQRLGTRRNELAGEPRFLARRVLPPRRPPGPGVFLAHGRIRYRRAW